VRREDARGQRVAIVADYLVNPGSALHAGLPASPPPAWTVLVEDGWGVMKPPSHGVGEAVGRPAAAVIAGDAVDYRRHGYDVLVVAVDGLPGGGVWQEALDGAFRELGAPAPPVVRIALGAAAPTAAEIRAALAAALTSAAPSTGTAAARAR
jgi:hypothetical protein